MAPAFNQLQGLRRAALSRRHTDIDNLITHNTHQKRGCSLYQNKAMEFKSKWNCFLQGCVYLSIDLIILSQKTFKSKPFFVCKSAIKVLYVCLHSFDY